MPVAVINSVTNTVPASTKSRELVLPWETLRPAMETSELSMYWEDRSTLVAVPASSRRSLENSAWYAMMGGKTTNCRNEMLDRYHMMLSECMPARTSTNAANSSSGINIRSTDAGSTCSLLATTEPSATATANAAVYTDVCFTVWPKRSWRIKALVEMTRSNKLLVVPTHARIESRLWLLSM